MVYSISVVIPVHNEEASLNKTINELIPVLKKNFSDYEAIIVESGSTDKSGVIADQIAKKNMRIRVIHQGKKLGYGNALRRGLRECKNDLSVYTDCDRPYDFKYLAEAAKYMKNYDAVTGYRVGKRESFSRYIMSIGGNLFAKIFFGVGVKDEGFPFKMIKTDLIKKFNLVSNYSFITVEILSELKRYKAKIKEIPVRYKIRTEGKSKFMDFGNVVIKHLIDSINFLKKGKWHHIK